MARGRRLGGKGVLTKRWLLITERPRGMAITNGAGPPAGGEGGKDSCQRVGRCLQSVYGGWWSPTARVHWLME